MPQYRFSRHARNKQRFFEVSRETVEDVIENPDANSMDDRGHIIAWRYMGSGWTRRTSEEWIKVVYEADETVIVTISAGGRGPR